MEKNKVMLMTYPFAKGLEYTCVYIVGLEENSLSLQRLARVARTASRRNAACST